MYGLFQRLPGELTCEKLYLNKSYVHKTSGTMFFGHMRPQCLAIMHSCYAKTSKSTPHTKYQAWWWRRDDLGFFCSHRTWTPWTLCSLHTTEMGYISQVLHIPFIPLNIKASDIAFTLTSCDWIGILMAFGVTELIMNSSVRLSVQQLKFGAN